MLRTTVRTMDVSNGEVMAEASDSSLSRDRCRVGANLGMREKNTENDNRGVFVVIVSFGENTLFFWGVRLNLEIYKKGSKIF